MRHLKPGPGLGAFVECATYTLMRFEGGARLDLKGHTVSASTSSPYADCTSAKPSVAAYNLKDLSLCQSHTSYKRNSCGSRDIKTG